MVSNSAERRQRIKEQSKEVANYMNHIEPPPELYKQWEGMTRSLAFEAAYCAGADHELEACCQALYSRYDIPSCIPPKVAEEMRDWLRDTRRPKLPPETIEVNGRTYRLEK